MGRQDYETETMVVENMSYDWQKGNDDKNPRPSTMNVSVGQTQTLSGTRVPAVGVRRLTPRECERLQGFPDDYTLVTHRNKPAADGPRYKAIGNSMAVPVISWICKRIQEND
jgi:DNA (cytosine-5)-methyltransferase 1